MREFTTGVRKVFHKGTLGKTSLQSLAGVLTDRNQVNKKNRKILRIICESAAIEIRFYN